MKEEKVIMEKLGQILIKEFGKMNINYDTTLNGDNKNCLDLNSLEIVKLIVEIENTFNIIIDFDVRFNSIGDIIKYIILQESIQKII